VGFAKLVGSGPTQFALIKGYGVGEFCTRLVQPVIMIVPGEGREPEESDTCARADELVWAVLPTDRTVALTSATGTFSDVLDDVATRGIDGGVQLRNPRLENGQACVDLRIWAKIEVLGQKAEFDRTFPICVALAGCQTVWDIGWANVQLCYTASNQLCAKLCVGKWGISKCWDACVNLPFAPAKAAGECNCKQ
jgi:hypothetical protein